MTGLAGVWKSRSAVRSLVLVNGFLIVGVFLVERWDGVASARAAAGEDSGRYDWVTVPVRLASLAGWSSGQVSYGYNWAAMSVLLASLALTYARFLPPFGRFLLDHLGQTTIFFLLLLLIWGFVGGGLGIPNLIWDEELLGRACSALGAALLLALLGVNAYYLGITPDRREGRRVVRDMNRFLLMHGSPVDFLPWLNPTPQNPHAPRHDEINRQRLSIFLRFARLPFFTLISLPALFPVLFDYVPWNAPALFAEAPWGLDGSGDVRTDALAHLWSAATWLFGLGLGAIIVKLLLRSNATINNFLAWATAKDWPAPVAVAWAKAAGLGGFFHYLLIVILVYLFLGLCMSGTALAKVAGAALLIGFGALQPALTAILWTNGKATPADVKASSALAVLVLALGSPVVYLSWWGEPVSPAFAIFSLMGVLAITLVVSETRDVRPVYLIGSLVFVALCGIVLARPWYHEPITVHDMLALAGLMPIVLFNVAGKWHAGATLGMRWRVAAVAFATLLALAMLAGLRASPPVALAAMVCLLGCFATGPIPNGSADAGRRRWVLVSCTLAFWILLVNYDPFKNRFEELTYPRQGDEAAPSGERLSKLIESVYPYGVLGEKEYGLLENYEVLENWKDRVAGYWKDRPGCTKPKLVVVCASGGAIRSAYWATTVLDRLEKSPEGDKDGASQAEAGELYDHIRLITGASGGMVGMSYFVADQYRQANQEAELEKAGPGRARPPRTFGVKEAKIPAKSLRDVAGFIALQSPWRMLLPRIPDGGAFDRGMVLEHTWEDLRDVSFQALHEREKAGAIPSMVFSPMIVDDGRRLLISNLDLASHMRPGRDQGALPEEDRLDRLSEWAVPVARQNDLDNDNDGHLRNRFSISALELFKLLPDVDARRLTLATAARMNATFPFVSPAVNLPTDPPLRVVDAAYYDNYGVHVANAWMLQNREWLRRNTSGVLVVQTRDSVSKRERVGIPSETPDFFSRFFRGAEFFSSVGQALLQARSSTNAFRNDHEFVEINEVFRRMGAGEGFVATVVFENTAYLSTDLAEAERPYGVKWPGLGGTGTARGMGGDVPMSWYLTRSEMRAIDRAFPEVPEDPDLAGILRNFAEHQDDFKDGGNFKPLCKAFNFAKLFKTGTMAPAPENYDLDVVRKFYDDLLALAKVNNDELVKRLNGEGKEIGDHPRATALREIQLPEGLKAEDVLVYAHSEWLNDRAGFKAVDDQEEADPSTVETDEDRKYYTREFERAMNYHRWQAVWRWWFTDHSGGPAAEASASARAG